MLHILCPTVIALGMGEDKPCDQPLKYYMIATLLWSQVGFAIALCFVTHCVILLFWFPGLRSRFNAAKSYAPDIVYATICEVRAAKAIVSKSFSHIAATGFPMVSQITWLQVPSWGSSFASYWLPERGPGLSLLVPCRCLNYLDEKQLFPNKPQT